MWLELTWIAACAATGFPWLVELASVVKVKIVLVSAATAIQNSSPTPIARTAIRVRPCGLIFIIASLHLAHWLPKCKVFIYLGLLGPFGTFRVPKICMEGKYSGTPRAFHGDYGF